MTALEEFNGLLSWKAVAPESPEQLALMLEISYLRGRPDIARQLIAEEAFRLRDPLPSAPAEIVNRKS